jgi:hypothetical protein
MILAVGTTTFESLIMYRQNAARNKNLKRFAIFFRDIGNPA